MAAAIAVVPGQTGHNTPKETVLEHLGTPKVTIRAATNGRSSARAASARESHWSRPAETRADRRGARISGKLTRVIKQLAGASSLALLTVATTATGHLHSASITRQGSELSYIIEPHDGELRVSSKTVQLESRVHMQGGVVQSSLFAQWTPPACQTAWRRISPGFLETTLIFTPSCATVTVSA
jgi:hypothetical protein